MNKPRLSRQQARQQTRRKLLEAASEVIARDGFQAASVEDIAEHAGFSRGAFYSNFDNKDDLFAALVEGLCEQEQEELAGLFEQGGSAEAMRDRLRDFYTDGMRQTRQFMLYTEAKIHAVRNPAFRDRLLGVEHNTHDRIAGFVARYCRDYGLDYPETAFDDIACGLMALTEGISFARMLDPERVDDAKATAVLATFFDAIIRDGNGNDTGAPNP